MRSGLWSVLLVACSLLSACDEKKVQAVTTAYTKQGVIVAHAGGYLERIRSAIGKVSSEKVNSKALERIVANRGTVLIDDPAKVTGLPETLTTKNLFEDEAVKAALIERDEDAAADLLYEQGVRTVIVHSEVSPSTDYGAKVLSRLYHHDHLERFQLFWVGHGLLYYRVRKAAVSFDPKLAEASMRYIRQRLQGARPSAIPNIPSQNGQWNFVAILRGKGRELAVAFAQEPRLQGAIEELVMDLERIHRRRVEYFGFPPLAEHVEDLRMELMLVTERAYVEPRDEEFLNRFWELGVDGAFMLSADRKERGVLPGSVSYTRSINRPEPFLAKAAKQGRMSQRRPWRDSKNWLEVFRTVHYIENDEGGVTKLFRGVTEHPMESVTLESVRQAIVSAGEWYLANLQPNGQVVYKFWPSENRYSNEYNFVRHTLATWNLVQAWEMENRPEFLEGARAALDWSNLALREEDNPKVGKMAFYTFKNNQKLGSVVVNMLGIVDLARATGDHQWDELLVKMGNFTKFMQEPNGKFQGYHVDKNHPYYNQTNDIVPGEAALALVYLAEYFDDDKWLEPLDKYWEYYMPWFRTRAVKSNWDAPWPNHIYDNGTRLELVQMGPWTVMAANAYHRRTGNEEVAKFGLEVARWMIDTYQWSEERAPWPDFIGGYYKMPHELPAMQAFCYAEGTAAAYQLAIRAAPDEAPFFEKSTREAMRMGLVMQYNETDVYPFSRPRQVLGGIRYALNETKVRIDYVHHGLSAMYQYYVGAKDDPALPAAVRGDS